MQLPLVVDDSAHFSCHGCTSCCDQPWHTQIEADKARALDAHDFGKYPSLTNHKFYSPPSDGREGVFDLAKGEGTRCLFLAPDGKCIIHMELGPQAKPGMCLQFPYLPATTWTEQRVSLNYGCPSVQRDSGSPLTEQRDSIAAYVPPIRRAPNAGAPVAFSKSVLLGADEHAALMDRAAQHFGDSWDGDIWTRFSRVLSMLFAVLQYKLIEPTESRGQALCEMLRGGDDLPDAPLPPQIHAFARPGDAPLAARMLFAATLFPDTLPANSAPRMGLARRLTLIPKLMSLARLSGGYASRVMGCNVVIDAVMRHDADVSLDEGATHLLLRYMRARFWQRRLAGGLLPVVSGFHQHIHDFNAIIFLARAEAYARGASRLDEALVRRALTRVEFHIANQARLYDRILKRWLRAQLDDVSMALSSLRLMSLRRANVETREALQPAGR